MANCYFYRDVILNISLCGVLLGISIYGPLLHEYLVITKHPVFVLKACSVLLVVFALLRALLGKIAPQGSSTKNASVSLSSHIVWGLILVILSPVFYHVIGILFGAPLTERVSETFHLALLLTAATTVPCVFTLGSNAQTWIRVLVQQCPESSGEVSVLAATACSIVGTWLGAFPIPLDWDRPWQEWPISCSLGTIFGHTAGLLMASCQIVYSHHQNSKLKLG